MKTERESKVEEVTWTCCTYLTGGICSSEALLPCFLVLLALLKESLRDFYLLKKPHPTKHHNFMVSNSILTSTKHRNETDRSARDTADLQGQQQRHQAETTNTHVVEGAIAVVRS